MTKNANGISLKKSKRFTELNGVKFPNLPSADKLVEGELAINYAEGLETISTKNESGNVVTFSSDDYYSEKKLGSGFTGANSAKTVTEAIEEIQPNVNADWDEPDETSPAFIENKPFGDECESVTGYDNTFTAAQIGSSHYGSGGWNLSGSTVWREGDTYRVTINDDVYVKTCVKWGGNNLGLNMTSDASSPYTDTWSVNYMPGAGNLFASAQISSGEQVHLKIEQLTCTTKLIDNKYINSSWEKGTSVNSSVKLIGNGGTASGDFSVSEGYQTIASGSGSHAEGGITEANGTYSHAEGWITVANGDYSHTEGGFTQTNKGYSHAEGYSTFTRNEYEHASGRYNNSVSASTTFGNSGNTLFSVGNGTADDARHNVFEIRQNGDIYIVSGSSDIKLQDYLGTNITIDQTIDSTTSGSTNAVSTSAVYGFVTSYTPSITVDQVLDDTTSASTNPISSSAVYSAMTDNEMVWANAYVAMSGAISSHTEDVNIHLTSNEKAGLTEASTITSIDGYDLSQATATAIDPTVDSLLEAIAKLEKRIALLEAQNNS